MIAPNRGRAKLAERCYDKTMEKTDQQLIADFAAGDETAFEVLMHRYLKAVYNFVFQLTRDVTLADDLTQDTFFKAWKNMHRFDPKKSFKVWLFAIAKNTTYDYWKKKKTLPFALFENSEGYNPLEEVAEDKPLPDEILARVQSGEAMDKKLSQIPKKYQLILTMHYKDELSLLEISQVLGLPYNTIKSQHKRALAKLKEEILQPAHVSVRSKERDVRV